VSKDPDIDITGELPDGTLIGLRRDPEKGDVPITFPPVREGEEVPNEVFVRQGQKMVAVEIRGPAQVATKAYRDGYQRTFMSKGGSA